MSDTMRPRALAVLLAIVSLPVLGLACTDTQLTVQGAGSADEQTQRSTSTPPSKTPAKAADERIWVNVFPGPVRSVAKDVRDANTLYATTDYGLFETTDGGFYWRAIAVFEKPVAIVFAQSATSPQTLYLGLRNGGIYKSNSPNRNWENISGGVANLDVTGIYPDPTKDNVVYLVSQGRLHKTLNGGKSWGDISPQNQTVQSLVLDSNTPEKVVVTTQGRSDLEPPFISGDGGLSWRQVAHQRTNNYQWTSVEFQREEFRIFTYPSGGYYTQTALRSPNELVPLPYLKRGGEDPIPVLINKNFVLAGGPFGLFQSTDSGKTWVKLFGSSETGNARGPLPAARSTVLQRHRTPLFSSRRIAVC